MKKRNANISPELADADIDQRIYEAESIINATMKASLLTTFDATKHAIVRSAATDLATLSTITYNPGERFLELEDAEATSKLLQSAVDRALSLLSDPRTVAYLKSL